MDVNSIAPFLDAIGKVMPQLGFASIKRGRMSVSESNNIASSGVLVIIGLTRHLRGNIAYNMTEESAKKIASIMMMGQPVQNFDAMAESTIAELGNMLAANAAIIFEQRGTLVDISPPAVITGKSNANLQGTEKRIIIEMLVDEILMEVNLVSA